MIVTDTVPDVRPYVHEAAVFVVPLRMGGGTRLKVLEGLAMAKPVVSTSVGCEGIDVAHGEHLLIADDPETFAQEILRILADESLMDRLGRAGRTLVETRYRWEAVVDRLEEFYWRLLQRPGAAGGPLTTARADGAVTGPGRSRIHNVRRELQMVAVCQKTDRGPTLDSVAGHGSRLAERL